MLTTPLSSPFPAKPQNQKPPSQTTTTTIPSAKFQRRRNRPSSPQPTDYSEDEDSEYGSMGRIVLTSIKSLPSRKIEPVQIQPNPKKKIKEEEEDKQMTNLSGSDVLWALQRATKEKMRSKSKGKKKDVRRRVDGGDSEGKIDYGNVKDLNVKSDWGDRLEELESRLRQLETF